MKIAKVILFFKKEDKKIPDNYGPISLFNIDSKVLEKLMFRSVYSLLENIICHVNTSSVFPKRHLTSLALIELLDSTEWAVKSRPPTCQLIMSSKSNVHLE